MYTDNIAIENFIDFCDDMMITNEGAQTDAFKLYISSDCRSIKKTYREGIKLIKKDKDEALKKFNECIKAAYDLKKRVSELEKNGRVSKFFSYFNPLLLFIHNQRLDSVTPVGNTVYYHTTTYSDDLSNMAPNEVQREVQQALNLIIKKAQEMMDYTKTYWNKKEKKK